MICVINIPEVSEPGMSSCSSLSHGIWSYQGCKIEPKNIYRLTEIIDVHAAFPSLDVVGKRRI